MYDLNFDKHRLKITFDHVKPVFGGLKCARQTDRCQSHWSDTKHANTIIVSYK